jgi:predicted aconitase with swiveling domain
MSSLEVGQQGDPDVRGSRVASVAVLIGIVASVVAAATIWLLLTDPITVATAVETGEVSPLVRQLADVIYNTIVGLLDYL